MMGFTPGELAPMAALLCLLLAAAIGGWMAAARAHARRITSELLLARHQELSLDLMCTSSFDGYFVSLNPSWTRVLGFELDELLTRPFVDFVHPDDLAATLEEVDKQAKTGQLVFNFQNRYLCADGSYRWLEWTSQPDYEANLMYAVARDITDRKVAEDIIVGHQKLLEDKVAERTAELEQRATELRRANDELEQFASIASHDLQEPLRKIRMFSDRLRLRLAETVAAEHTADLERIEKAGERAQRLISDLLDFSRVTHRGTAFHPVDLGELAEDIAAGLEADVARLGGRIDIGDLPVIDADTSQMRQVLQCLVGNALKFHCPGTRPLVRVSGLITIATDGDNATPGREQCVITVEDNGIGFEERHAERVFGPFERLHSRSEYDGTGIGLSIARKIVWRHGGDIKATATPGHGATFTVTLPLSHPVSTAVRREDRVEAPA